MSECVVRMEMPKSCWVCPFGIDGYLWNENDARTYHVRLCSKHSGVEYHVLKTDDSDRPWYCDSFICSLPEGHGRLVDADACASVLRKLENEAKTNSEKLCYGYAAKMFEEAFTIFPADAERSETWAN